MIDRVLLLCSLLAGQIAASGGEDLKAEVRRLVRQLDAPQLAQREAAEAELLGRGPAVLDLLPPADDRASAEVQQRLGRIRQRLQQAAADASTSASTITLHADAMPLSKILRAFQEQSGNTIDSICRRNVRPTGDRSQADASTSKARRSGRRWIDSWTRPGWRYIRRSGGETLGVVAPPEGKPTARSDRASYSGPFRFEPWPSHSARPG